MFSGFGAAVGGLFLFGGGRLRGGRFFRLRFVALFTVGRAGKRAKRGGDQLPVVGNVIAQRLTQIDTAAEQRADDMPGPLQRLGGGSDLLLFTDKLGGGLIQIEGCLGAEDLHRQGFQPLLSGAGGKGLPFLFERKVKIVQGTLGARAANFLFEVVGELSEDADRMKYLLLPLVELLDVTVLVDDGPELLLAEIVRFVFAVTSDKRNRIPLFVKLHHGLDLLRVKSDIMSDKRKVNGQRFDHSDFPAILRSLPMAADEGKKNNTARI